MSSAKDLTKEPPRSPRERLGTYVILGRTLDKGRALLAGSIGEYHYDCPLDNILFGFKGVTGDEVKKLLEGGASDEDVLAWLDAHGTPKSREEVREWAGKVEGARPYEDPERKEWFAGECAKLGLDPSGTTLFDWLEADDRVSYAR
ncbi:MAG: DUF5069 domain-containing protein [Verrucomicrobia bacterium]|nr:DUF5069 domain-containing protein [Verrucomicrobiota bacterium]